MASEMERWQRKARLCGRVKRRCPIFPEGCPYSIVRAEELNDRVRDGNGWTLFAIITGSPAHTGGSLDTVYITTGRWVCQYPIFLQRNTHDIVTRGHSFYCGDTWGYA